MQICFLFFRSLNAGIGDFFSVVQTKENPAMFFFKIIFHLIPEFKVMAWKTYLAARKGNEQKVRLAARIRESTNRQMINASSQSCWR